jgi:hypothetical protein
MQSTTNPQQIPFCFYQPRESLYSAWPSGWSILCWCRPVSTQMNTGRHLKLLTASLLGSFHFLFFFFCLNMLPKLLSNNGFAFVLVCENGRYGHLTWEWKKGIRSYLHPVLFAVLYKVLSLLGLDTPWFMVIISFPSLKMKIVMHF